MKPFCRDLSTGSVSQLRVPPLRQRKEDIRLIGHSWRSTI
jgi:DNA-binding NtrC family response regulator